MVLPMRWVSRVLTGVGLFLVSASSLLLMGEQPKVEVPPPVVPTGASSDSTAFLKAAQEAEALRVTRRVSEADFVRMAKEEKTVILDARSRAHFDRLRIKGSKSLPYTEMAEATLRRLIPDTSTKILIYCRNNLPDEPAFVGDPGSLFPAEFDPPKFPSAGLNIPTYITLYIYGYRNVWELDPVVVPGKSVIEFESGSPGVKPAAAAVLEEFRSQVRTGTWKEDWPDGKGGVEVREVTAEIWTDAFQAAIVKYGKLEIPGRKEPYYLDAPLVLGSRQSIKAAPDAEIRLKPGVNSCMVRNRNIRDFSDRPVPDDLASDNDLEVEGGIWTTLAVGVPSQNGNRAGRSDAANTVPNCNGTLLFSNVRRLVVKNLVIRRCRSFGVHLGNVNQFHVEGIRFEENGRDGVHVNGPARYGVIRGISGVTHDDLVALNAWEWRNYTPTFGPIQDVLVERVTGAPAGSKATDAIRLLPGVKRFSNGGTLACPISDVVLSDLTDIREFKLYDQPNLEVGRDKDFSVEVGRLERVLMKQLRFTRPGVVQIAADVEGLSIEDVDLQFTPEPAYKLVEVGPMSATYRHGPDPARWVEIFSPDRDVTVKGFKLEAVRVNQRPVPDTATLVQTKDQKVNPDYPKSTPQGGKGRVRWEK